ncbi:MAG: hypothetical protein QF704_15485, partial [Anaerolineales bacterium]|nr:hypothetical protein [Anaerolineales bacterium]
GVNFPFLEVCFLWGGYDADISIETDGGYTYFDEEKGVACVQVKRTSSDLNLTRIEVLFSFDGTTIEDKGEFVGDKIPQENEMKQECFNLTNVGPNKGLTVPPYVSPDSIRLVPIYFDGVKEVVGDVVAIVTGSSGNSGGGGGFGGGNYPGDDADPVGDVECTKHSDCGVESSDTTCLDSDTMRTTTITPSCNIGASVCKNYTTYVDVDCGGTGDCVSGACRYEREIANCNDYSPLSESGRVYTLINNLSSSSGTCLTVRADSVTVNLNGYSINGSGAQSLEDSNGRDSGIHVDNADDVTIYGGSIVDFNEGVYVSYGDGITVRDIEFSSNFNGIYFVGDGSSSYPSFVENNTVDYGLSGASEAGYGI